VVAPESPLKPTMRRREHPVVVAAILLKVAVAESPLKPTMRRREHQVVVAAILLKPSMRGQTPYCVGLHLFLQRVASEEADPQIDENERSEVIVTCLELD
jgi:hypothetical protein